MQTSVVAVLVGCDQRGGRYLWTVRGQLCGHIFAVLKNYEPGSTNAIVEVEGECPHCRPSENSA